MGCSASKQPHSFLYPWFWYLPICGHVISCHSCLDSSSLNAWSSSLLALKWFEVSSGTSRCSNRRPLSSKCPRAVEPPSCEVASLGGGWNCQTLGLNFVSLCLNKFHDLTCHQYLDVTLVWVKWACLDQAEGSPIDRWNASQPEGLQALPIGTYWKLEHGPTLEVRYGDRLERINGIRVRASPAEADEQFILFDASGIGCWFLFLGSKFQTKFSGLRFYQHVTCQYPPQL